MIFADLPSSTLQLRPPSATIPVDLEFRKYIAVLHLPTMRSHRSLLLISPCPHKTIHCLLTASLLHLTVKSFSPPSVRNLCTPIEGRRFSSVSLSLHDPTSPTNPSSGHLHECRGMLERYERESLPSGQAFLRRDPVRDAELLRGQPLGILGSGIQ